MTHDHHSGRTPTPRLRRTGVVVLLGTLGLILAACGSSSASTTTTGATSSTTPPSPAAGSSGSSGASGAASFAAYQKCLSQHGVTLPAFSGRPPSGTGGTPGGGSVPPGGGSGFRGGGFANNPKFAAAEKACAGLRPKGGFGGGFARGRNSAAFAAYTNCLKLHGVTVTNGVPDRSSAAFTTAAAACAALRPTFSPTGGSTPPPTTSG